MAVGTLEIEVSLAKASLLRQFKDLQSMAKSLKIEIPGLTGAAMGKGAVTAAVKAPAGGVAGTGASIKKGMGEALSAFGSISGLAKFAGVAGAVMLIYSSSKMLQAVLGKIMRAIMMIVRPIGDILGVALMPILGVLRPIGQVINAIFKPYIKDAMKAMRAGMMFTRMGMPEKATESYATGISILGAPMAILLVRAFGELAKLMVDVMFAPITLLLNAFKELGLIILGLIPFSDKAKESFTGFMDNLIGGITSAKMVIKDFIDAGVELAVTAIENWAAPLRENANQLLTLATTTMDASRSAKILGIDFSDMAKKLDDMPVKDAIVQAGLYNDTLQKQVDLLKQQNELTVAQSAANKNNAEVLEFGTEATGGFISAAQVHANANIMLKATSLDVAKGLITFDEGLKRMASIREQEKVLTAAVGEELKRQANANVQVAVSADVATAGVIKFADTLEDRIAALGAISGRAQFEKEHPGALKTEERHMRAAGYSEETIAAEAWRRAGGELSARMQLEQEGGFNQAIDAANQTRLAFREGKSTLDTLNKMLAEGAFMSAATREFYGLPAAQGGGFVGRTGAAIVHEGETITPRGGGGMVFSPNITINATIGSDTDLRDLADRLADYMGSTIRSRVSY